MPSSFKVFVLSYLVSVMPKFFFVFLFFFNKKTEFTRCHGVCFVF